MAPEPKPSRGMPRSLLYALIPGGFILMVVLMLIFGRGAEEAAEPTDTVPVLSPAAEQAQQADQTEQADQAEQPEQAGQSSE